MSTIVAAQSGQSGNTNKEKKGSRLFSADQQPRATCQIRSSNSPSPTACSAAAPINHSLRHTGALGAGFVIAQGGSRPLDGCLVTQGESPACSCRHPLLARPSRDPSQRCEGVEGVVKRRSRLSRWVICFGRGRKAWRRDPLLLLYDKKSCLPRRAARPLRPCLPFLRLAQNTHRPPTLSTFQRLASHNPLSSFTR